MRLDESMIWAKAACAAIYKTFTLPREKEHGSNKVSLTKNLFWTEDQEEIGRHWGWGVEIWCLNKTACATSSTGVVLLVVAATGVTASSCAGGLLCTPEHTMPLECHWLHQSNSCFSACAAQLFLQALLPYAFFNCFLQHAQKISLSPSLPRFQELIRGILSRISAVYSEIT